MSKQDLGREAVTIDHYIAATQELYGHIAADKVTGRAIERAGYTLPGSAPVLPLACAQGEPAEETLSFWEASFDDPVLRPVVIGVDIAARPDFTAAYIPAPPPEPAKAESGEALGRFGHHPDPAVDFCLEVEVIQGEAVNHHLGFTNGAPSRDEMAARIERAMAFRVGGDVGAVAAKQTLREIEADFKTPAPPPEPAKAEVVEEEYRAHFGYSYGNDCWWVRVHGCKTESEAQSLRKRILSALATPPAAPAAARSAAAWKPTHRHVKRGSAYRVIGEAVAQVSDGSLTVNGRRARVMEDYSHLTVYEGADGKLWCRFSDEFNDGRFVALPGEEA